MSRRIEPRASAMRGARALLRKVSGRATRGCAILSLAAFAGAPVARAAGSAGAVSLSPATARAASATPDAFTLSPAALEEAARALLDSPVLRNGDMEATVEATLAVLEDPALSELAEAALLLLEFRFDGLVDRARIISRLEALERERLSGEARRLLDGMLGFLRRDFVLAADQDAFATCLRDFRVLGPLPPRSPIGGSAAPTELQQALARDPGFDREHPGLERALRWRPLTRGENSPWVETSDATRTGSGVAILAASFVTPGGGPAWIEIDARFPSGVREGHDRFPGGLPAVAVSWNGAPFEVHDLRAPRPTTIRLPVALRDGVNRLLLRAPQSSSLGPRYRVRVLDERAEPLAVGGFVDGPLGRETAARPPTDDPFGTIRARLEAAIDAGPHVEGLLGSLLVFDSEYAAGRAHLASALERAPDATHLKAILLLSLSASVDLPDGWRQARARALAEAVLEADPTHFMAGQFVGQALAAEDREEEALALVERLEIAHPRLVDLPLFRGRLLRELGLDAQADAALSHAFALAPRSARVARERAARFQALGQTRRASDELARALRLDGYQPSLLAETADAYRTDGRVDLEMELRERIVRRDRRSADQLIDACLRLGQLDRALELLQQEEARLPEMAWLHWRFANLHHRRGEPAETRERLSAANRLDPSGTTVRNWLADLGVPDEAREFLAAQLVSVEEVLADYDDLGTDESRVLVIDHATQWFFDDGSSERLTQNLYQARDLEGCEELGTLGAPGELLSIAVLDGRTFERSEPIEVNGEYVLPSLEPGDYVELIYRETLPAPANDVFDPWTWYLASVEQPFHWSRVQYSYPSALAAPDARPRLRVVGRHLEGVGVERVERDGRVLERFEVRRQPRVLLEPSTPPPERFLPTATLGGDLPLDAIRDFHAGEAAWNGGSTPEVAAVARELAAGSDSQSEIARRLHAFVSKHVDRPGWNPTHPTRTLIGREGNPTFLFMALLDAVGIERELVWARGYSPAEDPVPDPPFVDAMRWRQRPLVRVLPDDGPEAWCDLSIKLLPYGVPSGDAPGAEALATGEGEFIHTPSMPLSERPGVGLDVRIRIDEEGAARVAATAQFRGLPGYSLKEQVRDLPENARVYNLRGISAQLLRGFELASYELPGLDDPIEPLGIEVEGTVRRFLDRDGDGFACNLPIVPLNLGASFAGEGERRLPFFLSSPIVSTFRLRIELPDGLELIDGPESETLECAGGTWSFAVARPEPGVWTLERQVAIDAFELPADAYGGFVDFCRSVDNVERGRLRFAKR